MTVAASQLVLVDQPPRLTARQQTALDAIVEAGFDGLHTDEVGATVHAAQGRHPADELCAWCGAAGMELGKALRRKGLAQQRRRQDPAGRPVVVWTVTGRLEQPDSYPAFNQLPAGY